MQPSQPKPTKPVMDVTVPVASSASVPVQKAPVSNNNESAHSAPAGIPVQLKEVNEKALRPGPQQPTPPSLPVGTIVATILVIVFLSALAIMIYFQSNA